MSRVFITGSSDGLGQMAARFLVAQGHRVVLHARNAQRAEDAKAGCPGAETVLVADLSSIEETKRLAQAANDLGRFDAVIHNAGLGYRTAIGGKTKDGIAPIFAVNSLAPYILTSLMHKPKRLVYLSSGLHKGGDGSLKDVTWTSGRQFQGFQAYSDSKLHDVLLAFAVARHWPGVASNSVDPDWVATKMGGAGAPGDPKKGTETQVWLAVGDKDGNTGKHWHYLKQRTPHQAAGDVKKQEEFLRICEEISGVPFPR